MIDHNIRLRSFMYLPAYNRKYFEKAITCDADAIILDLEDSVPPDKREKARELIIEYDRIGELQKRRNVFIRINPINTEDFVKDISELCLNSIDGFMPSKITSANDIMFIDKLLSFHEIKNGLTLGKFKLTPLIETTDAIENISEIAKASNRLIALCLGGEDYLNDLGSIYTYQETALAYPRFAVVNAARANNLLPIDTPFLKISDIEAFEEKEKLAYKNGFAGCQVLSPKQIEPANRAFSPDAETILFSKRVVDAFIEASKNEKAGVAMLDGAMVGPPMQKRAKTVLDQAINEEADEDAKKIQRELKNRGGIGEAVNT